MISGVKRSPSDAAAESGGERCMRRVWSLRTKIVVVTMAVVLSVLALTTFLTIRMSRGATEDDLRTSGLALARELAASVVSSHGPVEAGTLQQELTSLLGRGSVVRDAAIYAVTSRGLVEWASAGPSHPPWPEVEIAAREGQEITTLKTQGEMRSWRVAVPIWEDRRSVGAVALSLPLGRTDALARHAERQAIGLGVVTGILLITSLSVLMNRAFTSPVRHLAGVMQRAEAGDLNVRAPEDRRDELGRLSRGLNRMLERVGSFQTELTRQVSEATAELRTVNERLYRAQQQVARNERLAAAGEMAAAMAHDVGTPLTAVSGHLQLLEEDVSDAGLKERLRLIQGHVDRVVAGARRFLDAARPEAVRVPVDVNALLVDLQVLTTSEVRRKGIAVAQHLGEDVPPVMADPAQMQELLLNLITNALEAMERGGRLTLTTEATREDGGMPTVRVTVSDTGPGMDADVLAHAFEPFFTTRGASGGTGLGLAICRRLARDHGGSIHLESAPGEGTRAVVELPASTG